jgi:hypothetical protein
MTARDRAETSLVLPLPGMQLVGCLMDHGLNCQFANEPARTYLRVEGWIRYTTPEGSTPEMSALDAQASGIAKRIVGLTVKSAAVHADGDLSIVFADGSKLSVEADREYHAWELVASTGMKVLCGPGGKIEVGQLPPRDAQAAPDPSR